jgi:ABC-type lipopolysaccharide export system ATPase subunit
VLLLLLLQVAVSSLNLAINRGECFGLLGPNGAGEDSNKLHIRTTLTHAAWSCYNLPLDRR